MSDIQIFIFISISSIDIDTTLTLTLITFVFAGTRLEVRCAAVWHSSSAESLTGTVGTLSDDSTALVTTTDVHCGLLFIDHNQGTCYEYAFLY